MGLPSTDGADFDVVWNTVTTPTCTDIDRYEFHLQCEDKAGPPPANTTAAIPNLYAGFWDEFLPSECTAGTPAGTSCATTIPNASNDFADLSANCQIVVTAVDMECNETSTVLDYMTDNDTAAN
jgi:hypothetical protein